MYHDKSWAQKANNNRQDTRKELNAIVREKVKKAVCREVNSISKRHKPDNEVFSGEDKSGIYCSSDKTVLAEVSPRTVYDMYNVDDDNNNKQSLSQMGIDNLEFKSLDECLNKKYEQSKYMMSIAQLVRGQPRPTK